MIRKTIIVVLLLGAVGTGTIGALSSTVIVSVLHSGPPTHRRLQIDCTDSTFPDRDFGICAVEYSKRFPKPSKLSAAAPVWYRYLKVIVGRTPIDAQTHDQFLTIQFPLIPLILLFASYPALAFIRGPLRRWRRQRKGLCLRCGYNLEGNVSGTCSECGEAR